MSAQSERRWAQLAREMEFSELSELREQAEGWRNGLTGLTALLAVLVTLKGRDDLSQLPSAARNTAAALLGTAFLCLTVGSVLALRAAHGRPGSRVLLTGQVLRRWTEQETIRVTGALRQASVCCVAGIVLVCGAVAVAWTTTESPSGHLVRVVTTTGERCGEFLGAGSGGLVLRTEDGRRSVLSERAVVSVVPVDACGSGAAP
ncbi:hypothetical protein EDD90_8553 [Streptomyces sp. Ag109_O5-1]|uniref:hypothetical protein n=1 Tax=Streptomyces sp. Ag109_O5-1 TaxID=1938851 RepID=UPI000F50E77F|nr:hypothetical protein [Streptomyces sp. Ag109_O5-1]RPE45288.1 hypothetical protein EDD90_8553 [Streptomyces sp. Ag109_O5-1]